MGKNWKKRWIAGALAAVLCCSTFLQAGVPSVSAAEGTVLAEENTAPAETQDTAAQADLNTARVAQSAAAGKTEEELFSELTADPGLALTITEGEAFEVRTDFTGLKLGQDDKAELKKAAMEDGTEFDYNRPGIYKCLYLVTPQTGEAYYVARNITVTPREAETEGAGAQSGQSDGSDGDTDPDPAPEAGTETGTESSTVTESGSGSEVGNGTETEAGTEITTGSPETEILPEEELDQELAAAELQDTLDEESGLTLGEVLEQAEEQEVGILALDAGETLSFEAVGSANTTENVEVTRGTCYYYSDYGLGSYLTYKYTVKFGSVSATAYCIEPSKSSPGDGTYTITRLGDGKVLAKVCYYGTKASGENGFFKEKHPDFSAGMQFVITHLAVSYASGSSDAFSGANSTGQAYAMELYNYCISQPDIPDVEMSFSNADVTAYIDGKKQRTEEITFRADTLQTVTMKLPDGVKLVNVTTGETSKAGADVEICGGTTFYLTAPLSQASDVAASWSSTMKGSITKDYSAYKITTGTDTQNLALVFGEGVAKEKYIDFKVSWVQQSTVKIIKKDGSSNALLAGAVYGIYRDAECTDLIVQMPATDADGVSSVTLDKTQDVVYLKEISGPSGYALDTSAHNITLAVGSTVTQELTDQEQMGSLTVYKEGEVLTGANASEEGVSFVYELRRQKGAVYNVYAGAEIAAADGTVLYSSGALVAEGLVTGDDGSVTLDGLHLGTYVVTETKAPEGFVCTGESQTVQLTAADASAEIQMAGVTFTNARQKASVSVEKQDSETKNPLSGGVFGLYAGTDILIADGNVAAAKDTLIEKITTGADGKAAFTADLPFGSYYVKELQAPNLYFRNVNDVYSFDFAYTGDKEPSVSFSHTFTNKRVSATIQLFKEDSETGSTAQGDATLEGAVYGVYAREDIVHPDGISGVVYHAGDQVGTLKTDEEGHAKISGLYPGKYYVKEITPPTGYLADEEEHDLNCGYEGDETANVVRNTTSVEVVKKQPFQIIKAANNGKTDADLLKGAGFSAYLESSLKTNEDGSYDFTDAEPVVLTADGKTEMFTDEKGYACSVALPYGTYVVRETTTPHNYTPVDDFTVTITDNSTEPQTWRVLLDDEFSAKLKIVKQDGETKQTVLLANTEFRIYDLDAEEYVEQVTTYPSTEVHKSYFTDENGYLILPEALSCGNYRIEEVTAPEGYILNTSYVEIRVDSNTAYQMDSLSGDAIITVIYENQPVKGKLVIRKSGEILKGFSKDFTYEESSLAGAEFAVYAAEDICSPDHQTDGQGNRHVVYEKDTLVGRVTTDENGEAVLEDLPLGTYRVEEVHAPEGYVLSAESKEVTFAYGGQTTPVVEETVEFSDRRQKVEITVEKQDAQTGAKLGGAVFGLYNKEEITSGGKAVVKADTLLQKITSDDSGKAQFTLDLPLGSYYVKELEAPDGYVSSDEVLEFDASYQGETVETITLNAVKKNEPTTVELTKADAVTGTELDGASLTVLDKDGNTVDSWISVKEEPHVIRGLTVGETYTLREELAPWGYLKASEVEFTVVDTAEVQKVQMEDDVPTAKLIVNKKGEFLDSVTLLDNAKGVVEHLFHYITGNLSSVTFQVYAAEDIRAADGVSADYYAQDELVGTITTDGSGFAQLDGLPAGRYYIVEQETAHGYVLDGEPRYVDLSYRDQDTPVITYSTDWQNSRQRVQVNVLKKEKDSEKVLSGAIFGLFAGEDIISSGGEVLIEKDTIIELKTTDADGRISFIADLPVDGKYYVKELYAPDGYVAEQEKQEFTFEYQGSSEKQTVYEFTFENQQTTVEISKADLTDGKELAGAHLQVLDESGMVAEEWISEETPHTIRGLIVGKTYTLVETKPADGYATAESIQFTVENTAEIQKQQMLDDVTKVRISKTDITGTEEIPGAKLTILDADGNVVESWVSAEDPHLIEKLPVGTYTLREEQAPDGYLLAEDVSFTVEDTGEIQEVKMQDGVPTGRLTIKKTDADSGVPLSGAEFEIREKESGKVVEKLVTDGTGTAKSGEIAAACYEDGKRKETIAYVLVETKAPDGYELSEKEDTILFEYKDSVTKEIEILKEITNTKSPAGTKGTTQGSSPKTGDPTNIWLPVLLSIISCAGIAGVIWYRKKKHWS